MAFSNLDLEQLDPDTGAIQRSSASAVDNVEQVRSPTAAGEVIYKVRATTATIDGLPAEPYALAARRQITPLVTPEPTTQLALTQDQASPGEAVTVEVRVRNPSPELSAEAAQVTLNLPTGVELVPGSPALRQSLGTLAPGSDLNRSWTVRGTSDGVRTLSARSEATRYGEALASDDARTLTVATPPPPPPTSPPPPTPVDSPSAPVPAPTPVPAPSGTAPATPFVPALPVLASPAPSTLPPAPAAPTTRRRALVALAETRVTGAALLVSGTLRAGASGRVTVVYSARVKGRLVTARRTARARRGRFGARLPLPGPLRRAPRATLVVRYAGDGGHRAETVRRTIRRAR